MNEKDYLLISLKKLIEREKTLLQEEEMELSSLPEGKLITRRHKNGKYFYVQKIKEKEYGITRDTEKIEKLSRKKILDLSLSSHSRNIEILTKANKQIMSNVTSLFHNTNLHANSYGKYNTNEAHWLTCNHSQNPYAPEHLIYKCNNGLMVRSKSERTIVNKLLEYGIVFRYEAPIEIDGVVYYPDFTILKKNGDIVLWEHNGLMTNEEYLIKALQKIRKYKKKGFVQHKNLICTEEDDIWDENALDEIIYKFILS